MFVYQRDQFTRAHTKEGRKNEEREKHDDRYRFKTNQPTNSETWPYNIEKKEETNENIKLSMFFVVFLIGNR